MWEQYKKTFMPVQVLIALTCTFLIVMLKVPVLPAILGFGMTMEGAAFIGAAWSTRLKRKIERQPARLLVGKLR